MRFPEGKSDVTIGAYTTVKGYCRTFTCYTATSTCSCPLSSARLCRRNYYIFYLPSAQLLVLWFTAAAARVPLARWLTKQTRRRPLFVGCCAHPSLISRCILHRLPLESVCCAFSLFAPREKRIHLIHASCRHHLLCFGQDKSVLSHQDLRSLVQYGKRAEELETEETGLSAFHQKLGFSGKKVLLLCETRTREAFIFLLD